MYAFSAYYASSGGKAAVIQQASKMRPRTKSPSHKMRVHHEESNQQVSQDYIVYNFAQCDIDKNFEMKWTVKIIHDLCSFQVTFFLLIFVPQFPD